MSNNFLFACCNPTYAHWQLGTLPALSGQLILIGWTQGAAVDCGVPIQVARLVALALTSFCRVSFPVSPHGADDCASKLQELHWLPSFRVGNWAKRARAALRRESDEVRWLSSRDPVRVARLFDDATYPWHLQGQVALLSAANAATPDIDENTLFSLMEDDWVTHAVALRSFGVDAVLRPGVDGDVIAVLMLSDGQTKTLLQAFEREARAAEYAWLLVDETDFAELLANEGTAPTQQAGTKKPL